MIFLKERALETIVEEIEIFHDETVLPKKRRSSKNSCRTLKVQKQTKSLDVICQERKVMRQRAEQSSSKELETIMENEILCGDISIYVESLENETFDSDEDFERLEKLVSNFDTSASLECLPLQKQKDEKDLNLFEYLQSLDTEDITSDEDFDNDDDIKDPFEGFHEYQNSFESDSDNLEDLFDSDLEREEIIEGNWIYTKYENGPRFKGLNKDELRLMELARSLEVHC